jgi:hypothetical protein
MREFASVPKEVQVRGTVVDTFVSAFGPYKNRGTRILARIFGTDEIGTGEEDLYPLHLYLQAMKDIQEQFGHEFMQRIGSYIFEKAVFPPGIDSLVQAMALINTAFYMNHTEAEGKIGGYHWAKTGDRSGQMTVDCPYPCVFDLGILTSIATRFESGGKVTHDDAKPCRRAGGDTCTYRVEW